MTVTAPQTSVGTRRAPRQFSSHMFSDDPRVLVAAAEYRDGCERTRAAASEWAQRWGGPDARGCMQFEPPHGLTTIGLVAAQRPERGIWRQRATTDDGPLWVPGHASEAAHQMRTLPTQGLTIPGLPAVFRARGPRRHQRYEMIPVLCLTDHAVYISLQMEPFTTQSQVRPGAVWRPCAAEDFAIAVKQAKTGGVL